jgi:RNA polymerase sigma factor (sigma-70 family)
LIYSIALRLCRDHEAAADVRQQVFLQLYQQLDDIKNVSSLPAWIATVARRRACDHLRSIRPTEPLLDDTHEHLSDPFNRIQFRHTVETALARLPERSRGLIEMLYISQDQPTYEEVAAKLGIPVSSIGPTRIRTLKKLRQLLS